MANVPPPVVQLPSTVGRAFGITDATDGLLLDKVTVTPLAGAILESVTSTKDSPPAVIVEGLSVKEASGGGDGSVPPGFNMSNWGTETSWRDVPDASVYAMSVKKLTGVGEVTTAVDKPKVAEVEPAGRSGTAQ